MHDEEEYEDEEESIDKQVKRLSCGGIRVTGGIPL